MVEFGKTIIFIGIGLTSVGLFILALNKFIPIGRLPGDVLVKKESFTFYFPLTTCVVLSLILSLIMYLISKK